MPSLVPPVLHPLLVHAPLILLPLAALAASLKRWWPWVAQALPPLLVAAAVTAVAAAVSGYVEKDAAEEEWAGTAKADWIDKHQVLGIATAIAACLLAVAAWVLRRRILQEATWAWLACLWVTAGLVVGTGWYGGAIVWDELEPVEFDRSGFGSTATSDGATGPAATGAVSATSTAPATTTQSASGSTTQSSPSSTTTTSGAPAPSGYTGQETGQTNAAGLPIWEIFVETNEQTGSFGYSPADIVVPTNHEIRLHYGNFDAENRRHDIWVGESGSIAKTAALNAGQTDTITFTVGGAMTTIFYCDVGNHRAHGMIGDFVVQ